VIGINNAIDQRAHGIGFAIPINLVKKVLPQLRTKGVVARGYIGVLVEELRPELATQFGAPKDLRAPFVTNVYPEQPADKAGMKPYDVILEFNGKKIHTGGELITAVTGVQVGDSVPIRVLRGGQEKDLTIKVTQRPGAQELVQNKENKKGKKNAKKPTSIETGMTIEDATAEVARDLGLEKPAGVWVSATTYGGPADKAGILRGDVILEVDRKPVKDTDAFNAAVKEKKGYLLRIRRVDPQGNETFNVIVLNLKG